MILQHSLALMVISPITAALIIRLLSKFEHSDLVRDSITFIGLLIPLVLLLLTPLDVDIVYEMGGWPRPFGISLVLNGLSRVMVLITGIVTLSTYVYYVDFLDREPEADDYHFLFLFMTAGLYGVFLTGDLVNRFIFFEITILTTYVLLTFIGSKESLRASFRYFIIGAIASLMFLIGIGLTYFYTGYLDVGALSTEVPLLPTTARNIIFVFFLVAVSVKLGLMPFHTWLPDTHVEAPTPMTAVLAGVTVKTGGYILLKFYEMGFDTALVQNLFVAMGVFTAVFGAVISLKYVNMKRILAWLTISHVGVIAVMLSLWTPESVGAGLLYLVNHSLYKALLFLSLGSFVYLYGTSDIRKLPIFKSNIVLSCTLLIGLLALMGVPPLNGFYSRWLVLSSVNSRMLYLVMMIITTITSASVIRIILLSSDEEKNSEKSLNEGVMASLVVLAGLTSFLGVSVSLFLRNVIEPAVVSIFGTGMGIASSGLELQGIYSFHGMSILLTVILGLILSLKRIEWFDWSEGILSNVTIRDSVRYIIYIMGFFLLINFLF